jgi:uncharacterized protein (TIGR04551 family)
MGGGMGGGGMGGPTPGGAQTPAGDEKKEGVAVEAPKTPGLLPTTPALPPPKSNRKRYRMLELDGYFRFRTEWDKDFWMGFNDNPSLGGAPWPEPPSCNSNALNHPCDDSTRTADMRLRLEPTIHLSEGTSIHIQADALDNVVLGSTPDGLNLSGIYTGTASATGANQPPLAPFLNDNQVAPQQGVNSNQPSILVKRAWGEIALPLGVLSFGRMPNQWGMGIWKNGGGYDPNTGTYDYEADYGDSVDRLAFSAQIPGTPLKAMVAADWSYTALTSNQTPANIGHEEHPFNIDDSDAETTYVGTIQKTEAPQEFKDAVERGETMFDYGAYFEYDTQGWAENLTGYTLGNNPNNATSVFNPGTEYVPRHMTLYSLDLWGKLAFGGFKFESELVGILGEIDQLNDEGNTCAVAQTSTNAVTCSVTVKKAGGVARGTYSLLDDKLHLGLETGFATGDQWANTPQGDINVAYANLLGGPNATDLTQFIFNREYKIDLILWRQLAGAVTNAVYGRPFISYDITKAISAKLWNVTSAALKPVSTPGHDIWYGTEFDADVMYGQNGIYAGISAGVLFPFSALEHPTDSTTNGGPGYGYGTNTGDPATVYTIMTRLILAF